VLSLWGMYHFVYVLWQKHLAAFIATAFLALQSIQLFISRFASYDVISFACFSLSLAPLILACQKQGRARYSYLLLSAILMTFAITSKYVVVLYLPLLAGLVLLYVPRLGLIFSLLMGSALLAYIALHWSDLQTLYRVQIQGVHGQGNGSAEYIIGTSVKYLWPAVTGWLVALIWCGLESGRNFWRYPRFQQLFLLGLLAMPLVVYHLHALNMISLFKHLLYAQFFLLPATAWFIATVLEEPDYRYIKQAVLSVVMVSFSVVTYQQLQEMEVAYTDVSALEQQVQGKLQSDTTILSEDPYLFRYLGMNDVPQIQIKESGWLDNNLDGKHEHKDVIEAVWDAKFTYVYLNDQLHPSFNVKLRKILALKNYQVVWSQPYQLSSVMTRQAHGTMSLYQRTEQPRVSLLQDDLFGRGRGISDFHSGGRHD